MGTDAGGNGAEADTGRTDPDAGDPHDDQTEDRPAQPDAGDPGRRSSAWLAWTLVVALAVVTAVAVLQWRAVAGPQAQVEDATTAATEYVLTLSNWDAGDGLEETYTGLLQGATEAFQPEIDDVFGAETRDGLVAIDAVSTGTIISTLDGRLADGDPPSVEVIVIVEQFVVTGPTADPVRRDERVALLRMVRTGDTWLVDDLEMLSELQLVEETN